MRDLKIGLKQATVFLIFHLIGFIGWSQEATYKVSNELIKTYPFSDPNPVPPVAVNNDISRFYPYFTYEGYAVKDTMKDWKVVELENKFLKVKILPEVGGKVWGAIEKSTGFDFIYLNHVLKFRAIGIRGPWTSGGIEHNFGLDIGHAPWTASPVDYIVQKNPDGSVSCTVGGLDLASRTQWRVEIRLAKDAAYFETRSLWYNATPYHLSYLSWENAGFKADDDLEFYFPGDHYLGHDGSAHSWPSDEKGRLLSLYKNNNFGSSKSYHTIGSYRNFYGGYWHNKNIGFGHWAPYSDAPGKKVWIWSLARDGAIWKDLLTDTDGQYIEAQSGVTFNQADFVSGLHSPFKQLSLRPGYSETKTESWFPVMNTSGIIDASREGVLNVIKENDSLQIIISPTQKIDDSLYIRTGSNTVSVQMLHLQPLQVYHKKIKLAQNSDSQISVQLGVDKLSYEIGKTETGIKRPLVFPRDLDSSDSERFFLLAEDENSMRKFDEAFRDYSQCISKDPYHLRALSRVAELYCRSYQYEKALAVAQRALAINTYDPDANYIYAVVQRRMGKSEAALEAFSVAVRSMEYRSEAYSQLAGIKMQQKNFG
ncbi:MAG: repeat-containing protein, partial [Chitinophagaceae bacterium]|nr:repeat-containing protein [Chitinophagaceae bacterium]